MAPKRTSGPGLKHQRQVHRVAVVVDDRPPAAKLGERVALGAGAGQQRALGVQDGLG